jgi:voltage-gated potassium channel
MTGSLDIPTNRRSVSDRLAAVIFFLALAFLVTLAGLIHRFPRLRWDDPEALLILGGLVALWLILFVDTAIRFRFRTGPVTWKELAGVIACGAVPALRLACRSSDRPTQIWLPILGWRNIDGHLRRTLERFFSVPMILFALMVLPLFVLEYYWADQVHAQPILALVLDIGTSVIWLAFSIELIIMVAVADHPILYCLRHWIDVAIVLLPAVDVLPLFRLLRLGRVLRLEQLLRWGRLYRLKALATRGWRALFLLQIAQRLTTRSPAHRVQQLRELLQAKEEEIADLRQEIAELEASIAQKAHARQPDTSPSERDLPENSLSQLATPDGLRSTP